MLSHNNIIGTTRGNENGYRGVMDSDKMIDIFKKNKNIIAWMHGHNHNFEVINRDDMLFVSNGRIGGFDPSRGKYGIGGVYFEITKEMLTVKCYSAEKDMFLDSFDVSLSQTLDVKTTFDNKADFAYSYGVGGAVNGERIPAYHYHVGENTKSELFLTGCENSVINDDHAMTKYIERKAYHGLDKILFAAKVNHGNAGFVYTNPGIRLKANDNWWTTLTMPSDNYDKYSYYRCPLGQKYEASIDLVLNVDYAPTLLSLAGIEIPNDMQGKSFVPVLENKTKAPFRDAVYYHYYEYPYWHNVQPHYGIRTDRYKLIHYYYDVDEWELFDLEKDPNEITNIYNTSENSELVANLKNRLAALKKENKMDLSDDELKKMTDIRIKRRYRVEPAN